MNTSEYIRSGILEDYCMGLLSPVEMAEVDRLCVQYPAIHAALEENMGVLQKYAASGPPPPPAMKARILDLLDNLDMEERGDAGKFPEINRYSDFRHWLKRVEPLLGGFKEGEFGCRTLIENDRICQLLVHTCNHIPDEEHEDVNESFLILQGECEMHLGGRIIRLRAGDYMEVPLHQLHHITVTSPEPCIAIVQQKKVA